MQRQYWVMKIVNDSLAVRIPVQIGLQDAQYAEILSPQVGTGDAIAVRGAYGLADSTVVSVRSEP